MNFRGGVRGEEPEMNFVPLIDLLLVILIFLMVTTTYSKFTELQVALPSANADKAADLEPVAADLVTASGSGLDPHVTLRNALSVYQLDRVAAARGADKVAVAEVVLGASFTPLGGLVGEPLVNVLELNLTLDAKFPVPKER